MIQTKQEALPRRKERINWSRLWLVGPLVIVTAVVVNLLVSRAVLALFPTVVMASGSIVLFTVIGTLGAVLVFALVGWRAKHPITLYYKIAGVALLLSFVPDILLFTIGFPAIVVEAYMLMHIAAAAICVIGLTKFAQRRMR